MKTIVIASQKGGSGKTMLSAHLAVEAERQGDTTVIVDTDVQGTLSHWRKIRPLNTPRQLDISFQKLTRGGLKHLPDRAKIPWAFIDTPPTISVHSEMLMGLADLIIIPARPSPCDYWSVVETVATARKVSKPFLFVLNAAKPNTCLTAHMAAMLSEYGPVCPHFIKDRILYAASMAGGFTAPERSGPKDPFNEEISNVWGYLKRKLS